MSLAEPIAMVRLILWMDEILHHFETVVNHCLLVFTRNSSFQRFLGGAGFRSSTVGFPKEAVELAMFQNNSWPMDYGAPSPSLLHSAFSVLLLRRHETARLKDAVACMVKTLSWDDWVSIPFADPFDVRSKLLRLGHDSLNRFIFIDRNHYNGYWATEFFHQLRIHTARWPSFLATRLATLGYSWG